MPRTDKATGMTSNHQFRARQQKDLANQKTIDDLMSDKMILVTANESLEAELLDLEETNRIYERQIAGSDH